MYTNELFLPTPVYDTWHRSLVLQRIAHVKRFLSRGLFIKGHFSATHLPMAWLSFNADFSIKPRNRSSKSSEQSPTILTLITI